MSKGGTPLAPAREPELTLGVAAAVEADDAREAAFDLPDPEHVVQELAELEGAGRHPLHLGVARQQVAVLVLHHRDAAPRGRDHVLVPGRREDLQEALRERPRGVGRPGVGHGLAAAGLILGEDDLAAVPLEQPERGCRDGGV